VNKNKKILNKCIGAPGARYEHSFRKRIKRYSTVSILISMIFFSFFINLIGIHAPDPGGSWIYTSSRTVTYSVNQSSDDAILTVGADFASAGLLIPLRLPTYDTRFGFRIHVDDAVNNATHRELVYPGNAYFEVWSDDSTFAGSLSGTLSIYMTNETEVLTFANYTDLMNRPNHYFVGTTQISEFGRVGSSDPEWRDFTTNLLHNALNDMNLFPWTDNNTIAFIFQTTQGDQVYFWTFDEGHAPRLTVTWDLYEWMDFLEPDGYSGSTFIEEWQEGFFIWSFDGSAYGWINYTDYTLYNISGGEDFQIVSDSMITGYRVNAGPTDDFRLRRATPSQIGSVLLSVNITEVWDNQNGAVQWVGHLFGHANANKNVFDLDNELNRAVLLTVSTPNNATDNLWRYAIETHNVGVWNLRYGQHYNASKGARHYLNYTWNYPSKDVYVRVHDSPTFSDSSLIEQFNRTDYVNILGTYSSEFAFNTNSRPADSDYFSFNTLTYPDDVFIVADENGTVLDTFPTLEDARDFVGWYESSANPAYDAIPNLGNTIIAIMGLMGLIMIPGSFIMFGHSVKGGDWIQGFYYLLMMFFVGLGFVTVWLFG